MYKIFIDHCPIVFIDKEDAIENSWAIKFKALPESKVELRHLMKDASLERPLFVLCKNVDKSFKEYFKPYRKITAGGGIVQRKKKYLVIKRNGLWDIPKGKIEKGEDIPEGAVREIVEECGIGEPTVDELIVKTYHVFNYKGKKALKTTYWYKMSYDGPKETTPETSEGITKAKWLSLEDMLNIRGRTYGSINELLDVFESSLKDD